MTAQPLKGDARRGRRPRHSREAILAAAVELMERQPDAPFSLNALARELGVTPMAIYTYFGGSNDLLQALTEHVLKGLVIPVAEDATPAEAIAAWCHAVRAFFLSHPPLITMLTWEGGQASIAWLDRTLVLVEALRRLGLEGDALSRAVLWVWGIIMSGINLELHNRAARYRIAPEAVEEIDPRVREPIRTMIGMVERPGHFDDFYDYQVARLIDAITVMTAAPSGDQPA